MFYRLAFSGLLVVSALQGLSGLPSYGRDYSKREGECQGYEGSILNTNFWSVEGDKSGLYKDDGAGGAQLILTPPQNYKKLYDTIESKCYIYITFIIIF